MRVKSVVYTRQRKKKYFRLAKGAYATKKNRWRMVKQHIAKSLAHSYRGRKQRKRDLRRLWIVRLNAAARQHGLSYSKFIAGLRRANVLINRQQLAEMALTRMADFQALVEVARTGLK